MIHIVLGTKAQLIKMFPIIKILQERGVDYNYIDTGQHFLLTDKLRAQLKVKSPDYGFVKVGKNITTTGGGILWMLKVLLKSIIHRKKIFKKDRRGLCLVHGDTISTLLGVLMGLIAGQRIVHVESGFRTPKLFKPFPEEIVRRIVDRLSCINFPLSNDAEMALKKEKIKGLIFNPGENTLIDIVRVAQNYTSTMNLPKSFILVSIHRYETIYSKKRMSFITDLLEKLSINHNIVWGLHEPTKNSLIRFGLYSDLLNNKKIFLRGLFDYFDFIAAIKKSSFFITDGGGPQDESKYLGVPCLLMRTETEKLGYKNVCQCNFQTERVDDFLKNTDKYRAVNEIKDFSPSREIVEVLLKNIQLN